MKSLTRLDLAKLLMGRFKCKLPEARDVVNDLLAAIAVALVDNRKVELRGFGVLEPVVRKARLGRNPRKPERGALIVPQHRSVRFRVFRTLRDELNS